MTIEDVLNEPHPETGFKKASIRKKAWDGLAGSEEKTILVDFTEGTLTYRRFHGSFGWPWRPSREDLKDADWYIVDWT